MNMMKKYLFMLAAFIAATATFTACSSEEDAAVSPENELGDLVRAQFTISIPMNTGATTRMSADVVQSVPSVSKFRGINEIRLFPSAVPLSNFSSTSSIGKYIYLRELLKPTSASVTEEIPKGELLEASKSVLYGNVQLQIGTQTFLFYGKAIGKANDAQSGYTSADYIKYGWLTKTMDETASNVSGFKFSPTSITSYPTTVKNENDEDTNKATLMSTKTTAICNYLKLIADAQYTSGEVTEAWRSTGNAGFSALFTSFVNMKAGSSTNLAVAIKDLYFTCKDIYDDNGNLLAKAICDAINNNTYIKSIDATNKTLEFQKNIDNYPSIIDLPDGAAVLHYEADTEGKAVFTYLGTDANYASMNVTALDQYAYPANLYYWGKSDILTSESSQQDHFNPTMTWDDNVSTGIFNYYDAGNAITSKTRSVILKKQVQYGVGRLDFSVAASGSGTGGKLADNGSGTNAHSIDPTKIKLTGILIGGQKNVGWNFEPLTTGSEYTVYDNLVISQDVTKEGEETEKTKGIALATSLSTTPTTNFVPLAQTLVLETAGADATESVKVALEFVNNDQDFYGKDGIVPKGCKFYLVGALEMTPSVTGATTTKPTGYTDNKIFKQDFVTIAKFQINSLKNAENTIPDLRNPKVELGLSVDLTWQEGVEFYVPIP
jgi:hypothetical protein